MDEPPVCTIDAMLACQRDIGRVFVRRREVAKARLGEPDAFFLHLGEIGLAQPRLQDDGAGVHAHATGTICSE